VRVINLDVATLTRLCRGEEPFPAGLVADAAVAIGTFDGVHLGHRHLIRTVREIAARDGLAASCLFTFRNHPRTVVGRRPPGLLTTWPEKFNLLQRTGVDVVVAAEFCPALAVLPYDVFVSRFLVGMLGMRHLVGGYDVHLGAGRGGSAETLTDLAGELGFTFTIVPPLKLDDGTVVSSSAVRSLLAAGRVDAAACLLGRWYSCRGQVVPGDGVGTTLGFPTANLTPLSADKLLPAPGVYAVWITAPADVAGPGDRGGIVAETVAPGAELGPDGQPIGPWDRRWIVLRGVANYGRAPTIHAGGLPRDRLEVHALDFGGHLRGRVLKVAWVRRLRDERRFADRDALRAQLDADCAAARRILTDPPAEESAGEGAATDADP